MEIRGYDSDLLLQLDDIHGDGCMACPSGCSGTKLRVVIAAAKSLPGSASRCVARSVVVALVWLTLMTWGATAKSTVGLSRGICNCKWLRDYVRTTHRCLA